MFSSHVKQFSAYCQDELSAEDSRRVAEHLMGCPRCRAEFDEIKLGVRLAQQLPIASAPNALWTRIDSALASHTNEEAINPFQRSLLKPALAIAASLALLFVGGFLMLRFHRHETRPSWEVARLDGAPQVGSTRIANKGSLVVGQWLETDGNSRAQIDIGSIGQVQIDPNTRVRLVATQPTEHRLELARGRMSARISAPPKLFFVNTPSAVAEDLGCAYTLEVDDQGNSLLRVTLGWVSLQLRDRESVVPAGAACATRPGIGPGTPYFEDAPEIFRTALGKLDFEPHDTQWSKIASLDLVLMNARPRDTMTLWYLLSRLEATDRVRVYDRMVGFVQPPDGVTRGGVSRLDHEMLNRWREKIDSDRELFPEATRAEKRKE